mgnify:CR=1 FL=1
MMNYENFKEIVMEKFMDYMPENYRGMELAIIPVNKANVMLDGLIIRGIGKNTSPIIYVDDMYKEYQDCGNLEQCIMKQCNAMVRTIEELPVVSIDGILKDAKEKIVFQIINTQLNRAMLDKVPHRQFMDISIIYKIIINKDQRGIQSMEVTDRLAGLLGMNEGQLFRCAVENTKRIFPTTVRNLKDVLKDMCLNYDVPYDDIGMILADQAMWVISNTACNNGAANMLYENVLHELAEKLGSNLYILPSSVHEVIAVPTELGGPGELAELVNQANMQCVSPTERLSNHVYYYDRDLRKLTLAADVLEQGDNVFELPLV